MSITRTCVIGLALLATASCKKEAPPPPAGPLGALQAMSDQAKRMAEASKGMNEAMKKGGPEGMQEAMKKMGDVMRGGGPKVEPVDFRELKALLPEAIGDLKRSDASGEKTGAMGMTIAKAEAHYKGDKGARIHVTMTDFGAITGMMAMGVLGWMQLEIDKETETGYEKTTTIGGHKAHEKYDNKSQDGRIQVVVANRFMVEVRGNDMPMADIKGALAKIDLDKLTSLKPAEPK